MSIRKLFMDHPASVGETYAEHLMMATGFAVSLFAAGVAVLVHAFLPFLFVDTGSRMIEGLHGRMIVNRRGLRPAGSKPLSPQLER